MKNQLPDIWFYQRQSIPLVKVLAPLLARTLKGGKKAVVCLSTPAECKAIDKALWEDKSLNWLPHATKEDPGKEEWLKDQPIFLTHDGSVPNDASFLFRIAGAPIPSLKGFERVFDIFEGKDKEDLDQARTRWKEGISFGHGLSYWENVDGKWNLKMSKEAGQ